MPRSLGQRGAENFNLKGKKTLLCACRCCVVQDFREECESRRISNEELTLGLDSLEDDGDPVVWGGLVDVRECDDQDRGKWTPFLQKPGEVGIISSDFTHDVVLYVNGDFASDTSKMEYAQSIADRLNRTIQQ